MSEHEQNRPHPKPRKGQQWFKFEMAVHADMNERLVRLADAKGMNRVELVREAIREYLYRNEQSEGRG
jgi:hypothetical protein